MDREHVSGHVAIPGQSDCWPGRELHSSRRVGRVVFNWAHLHADEDDYER